MSTTVEDGDRAALVRSSAAVAAGTLLSRVTGLARVIVLAAVIGKATLADTYNLANTTPNILYELLVGGVLAATLVPVFVEHLAHKDDRSISAVFTVALTALLAFTAVTMALAPLIARVFALDTSGANRAAQVHVLTVFILCFVPQIVFYGFTALATALLNASRRFVAAAFAPVLNNLVVIVILLVFATRTSDRAAITDVISVRDDLDLLLLLGIGTTAGIVVMAVALIPSLARAGTRLRPVFAWRDPAVRTIVRLSGWTIGYVVANQLAQLFVLVLAKSGEAGEVSAYVYAFTFYVVPHSLLAVSIMTTVGPELARRAAASDLPGLRRDFGMGLRYIVLLVLPASVFFLTVAQPMLAIIVRNKFSASDAALTADVLQVFALSLIPFSVYLWVMRAFYALQDTRMPFYINVFENGCNILLAIALFPALGVQGLALAWGIAYLVGALVAVGVLHRRVGAIVTSLDAAVAIRAIVAAGALAIVTIPLVQAIGHSSSGEALLATVVAGVAGGLAYLGALVALRTPELGPLLGLVRRRTAPVRDV